MIALGLTVEVVAALLLVAGLITVTTVSGTALLWASVLVVLLGLGITALGVRRARPPRNPWMPSSGAPRSASGRPPPGSARPTSTGPDTAPPAR